MNKSISWRKGKKGFTIVELVVVIAVIAILAAVLIPTFVGLIQKANESTAFMDANNLVTTLIPELLDGENDTDLLIFSAKGGKIYVYGFRHDIRRVLPYWNNGTFELASGTSFADQVSAILDGFTQNGSNAGNDQQACVTKRDDVTVDDWRSPDKLAAMLTSNGFNGSTMAIRADYRILDNFFNADDISSGGGCDHNWQEISGTDTATCTEAGTAQVQCSKCKEFGTINTPAKGHEYVYTSVDASSHTVTCKRTGCTLNETEAHTFGTDNKCTKCGYEMVTAKNGLASDGFYYKDDVRYTGSVTDADSGGTYEFLDGRLVVTGVDSGNDGNYIEHQYTYTVTSDKKYATKEIVLKTSDTLDVNIGQTSVMPGNWTASKVTISGQYQIKSIGVTLAKNYKDAIDYLAQNVCKLSKTEILTTLENTYGFDESYYPVMTQSDDFKEYLSELQNRGVITSTSVSSSNYDTIRGAEYSYGEFLRAKYGKDNVLALPWTAIVNWYDSFHGAWPSSNSSANGIFAGNPYRVNGNECVFDDPEMILLFFRHTYENILFTGISTDRTKTNDILEDMCTDENSTTKVYQQDDSNWMSAVSVIYGVSLQSLYEISENRGFDLTDITGSTFYMFTASHQWLMTNMYQNRTFVESAYTIIAENPNWSAE